MSRKWYTAPEVEEERDEPTQHRVAPGKRSLTAGIRPSIAGIAPDSSVAGRVQQTTGVDLSGVRVHTGQESQEAAESLSARAFTSGQDIHFGKDEYQPGTPSGDRLLAHELVHTAQQRESSPAQLQAKVSRSGDAAEVEADRIASAALSGAGAARRTAPVERPAAIARFETETLSGNPNERTSQQGNTPTAHRNPTIGDAVNHTAPAAAGNEARAAQVRVVAREDAPLRAEPPMSVLSNLIYEENEAPTSPPAPGFTDVTGFNGTLAAPQIQEFANTNLFIGDGPSSNDVQQRGIGDCYFLAMVMSLVQRDPGKIPAMMTPDGSGGATVALWRRERRPRGAGPSPDGTQYNWTRVDVTVTASLAFNTSGPLNRRIMGAQLHCADTPRAQEHWAKIQGTTLEVHRRDEFDCARWAPLLEKAYSRFSQTHGISGGTSTRVDNDISGGWSWESMGVIYGPESEGANVQHETVNTPGADQNILSANEAVVNQLILLAGRGEAANGEDSPVITATASVNPLILRLEGFIPTAQRDADYANVALPRQDDVAAVATAITNWKNAPNNQKSARKQDLGNACADAVRPGPDDPYNPRFVSEHSRFEEIKNAAPAEVRFAQGSDAPPPGIMDPLGTQLENKPHPVVEVNLVGHSSSEGAADTNMTLSEQRVEAVENALLDGRDTHDHTIMSEAVGEEGASPTAEWRRVNVSVDPEEAENSLLSSDRSAPIRAMVDLMLDLRNIGTDASSGQRNIYGDHVYSVVGVRFVSIAGVTLPIQWIPASAAETRRAMYPLVDTNASTVRLRNPHHGNEPDRYGANEATNPDDGRPSDSSSDGTFTMTFEEFFRNFSYVDSGVFRRS